MRHFVTKKAIPRLCARVIVLNHLSVFIFFIFSCRSKMHPLFKNTKCTVNIYLAFQCIAKLTFYFFMVLSFLYIFIIQKKAFKETDRFVIYYRFPFRSNQRILTQQKWHTRFCSLSVSYFHFFIILHSIDSFSSSSACRQCELSWQQAGRQQTEMQCQLVEASFTTPCH